MNKENFKAIMQGWKNVTFPSEYFEKLATERAKICSTCPHFTTEYAFKKWLPEENRIEEIKSMACGLCGCPLSSKLRQALQSCPDKPARW